MSRRFARRDGFFKNAFYLAGLGLLVSCLGAMASGAAEVAPDLQAALATLTVGDAIEIGLERDHKPLTVTVTLGER